MARAYLCVSIDCECDKGRGWRSQRPLSFRGIEDGIARRLQPLFRAFGAKPTYLLSAEVLRDARSAEILRTLAGSHEHGTHLHGEYIDPGAHEPEVTRDFQRDYPREIEAQKLANLSFLFRSVFGYAATSFRAGRFGIGPHSLGILESLGYRVESSVTPFLSWESAGAKGLVFKGAPTQPYHPDPARPGRAGASPMWEVPVTIRPHRFARVPVIGDRIEHRWLRPTRGTNTSLVAVAQEEIHAGAAGPIILNCMFHNVEIIPGASPYADDEIQARAILNRLRALLVFAKSHNVQVIGLSDVPEVLERA